MATLQDILTQYQLDNSLLFAAVLDALSLNSPVETGLDASDDDETMVYVELQQSGVHKDLILVPAVMLRIEAGALELGFRKSQTESEIDLLFGKFSIWVDTHALQPSSPGDSPSCLCEWEGHLSLNQDWDVKISGALILKKTDYSFKQGQILISVQDVKPGGLPASIPIAAAPFFDQNPFLSIEADLTVNKSFDVPALPDWKIRPGDGTNSPVLSATFVLSKEPGIFVANPVFRVEPPAKFLKPMMLKDDRWVEALDSSGKSRPATIVVTGGSVALSTSGGFGLFGSPAIDIEPVQIGSSGIVVTCQGLRACLTDSDPLPAGIPAGSRGFAIDSVEVFLPESVKGSFAPEEILGEQLFFGGGGFTGKLSAEWAMEKPINLAGIDCKLKSLMFDFKQNSLVESELICELVLPFFDQPANLDVSFSGDGSLLASLSAVQPAGVDYDAGLIHFEKEGVFKATIEGMSFELKDGVSTLSVRGAIQPTFLSQASQDGNEAPTFKIQELSIDSQGHVKFDGGWMELPEQFSLDFHGFHLGITKLGFGKTDDGGKWLGVSGELKLVDGFTAGASVEGLRVTWYDDGRQTKISFNGIGVEFEIPDVLYFKGDVAYRELEVAGQAVRRFDGDITLSLISLGLEIDAKLVVGSASGGPQGNYNFFAIYLGVELPTGIPLSPTPLALFGLAGLFALQMEPNKKPEEEWYEGWYKRDEVGVTDLKSKWVNRRGSMAIGFGGTFGTSSDDGFTVAVKALLVIVFPGPIVLLTGRANLLKERAKLSDEAMFEALAVLDMREGQILIGLAAKYKQDEQTGKVIAIEAGAEAFFHNPGDWHVYMGEKEPRAKRIRARLLNLFEANSYFMIDPKQLATGAWVGYAKQWKFGPVSLTLEAWIEGNVVVNWTPLHFCGDLWLHGNVEVNVFGFNLGLSVDARFEADVFDPFHVIANFEVSFRLPKPFKKSKHFEITLEWGPQKAWPKLLPLPLNEVAVAHFKVTTSWPLSKDGSPPLLAPKYDHEKAGLRNYDSNPPSFIEPPFTALPVVPLDCRLQLTFGRPVHDDALIGINPQPTVPAWERIGDPAKDVGPVQARYSLKQIELFKWDQQAQQWRTVAVAGRPLNNGERKLFGSWAPVPQLPSGAGTGAVANNKLWLWSRTPFDYTRHGGSGVDDWFVANFPHYPCVAQDIPDREVCCDFERLARSQILETPWRFPNQPEITLVWEPRARQRVTILDPPVNGFTRALCFPVVTGLNPVPTPTSKDKPRRVIGEVITPRGLEPRLTTEQPRVLQPFVIATKPGPPTAGVGGTKDKSAPPLPNSLTINLSASAKRVKLWIVEGKKGEKVCLDFRKRQPGIIALPLNERGVTIGSAGTTDIRFAPTTLGDMTGLNCNVATPGLPSGMNITLPCAATTVELMLSYLSPVMFDTTIAIAAFNSNGEQVAVKPMLNPQHEPEIVRFEGSDLKQITIAAPLSKLVLHELCFVCPDSSPGVTATGFDAEGRPTRAFENNGNEVEVSGENLTRVQVNGKGDICLLKICALFGPDPIEVAHRQEMAAHLQSEVARWQDVGEVLMPFSDYRLTISTGIDALAPDLDPSSRVLTQVENAYFRTEGPPGLTKLSLPPGRAAADADKFDSGLEDLTRYVRQTTPATVPAVGEKPVMAKPFYRAYDIGVEFNEDYVDLMYRISGRDLGLYIYDSNNRPARDAEGRLLVQSGDWGAVEELTLTEGEQRWLALSNAENRCLPVISTETIAHDKKLTSAIAGRVLEPDVIHEARLIPLLLREDFQRFDVGAGAPGPTGRIGRWQVQDDGDIDLHSHWDIGETSAPVAKYITQTSSIKSSNVDVSDPEKPGTMLLFANDSGLDSAHPEQPTNWTDYRLSVYLKASGGGAMGLVFRFRDNHNYYRFSMDHNLNYRRLVNVANGIVTVLKEDDFVYGLQQDYLIMIEAIGDGLRVYQDGALIFDVTDGSQVSGCIGLYCYDNAGVRFSDVRVDDFRETAPVVYRFQFTTSRFANFAHHLHSYQDETWRIAVTNVPSVIPAMTRAVTPATPLSDDEVRGYETLASTVLGPAARQNPPEVQLTRVEIDGAPLAFLVQSPEPIDWLRTEIALSRTSLARTEPALPTKAKLAAVNFAANRIDIDSVVLLLREPMDLSAHRIEGRLVPWPLSPGSGVLIDAQAIPGGLLEQSWTTYHSFAAEKKLPAGTILEVEPSDALSMNPAGLAGVDAESVAPTHRIFYSVELRLVAPDGEVVYSRHFLPDDDYVSENLKVLRKADGTQFFMVKLDAALNVVPLSLEQYRLKLTYHRNNKARVSASQTFSQAGNDADEIVTLDIPLQTQD